MRIVILTNLSSIFGNLEDLFQSQGLENIPQVPGNRAEVNQNHDALKVVSATVSVLK